ncbi:MAG: DUF4097 family beta strand repeat protein [Myxococcales bacterium]|nr:DUF4097 family beta strand repeat protein [Myxococcales bacterium]
MNTHPTVSDLEALIAGTLDEDRGILISAHTDDCAVCTRELAWLRAERDLFAQRARGVPPSEVWARIEAQIADRLRHEDPAPRGLSRVLAGAFRGQRMQWFAAAGAAAAVLGMIAISPLSPLRSTPSASPSTMQPLSDPSAAAGGAAERGSVVVSVSDADNEGVVLSSTKVTGPIALDLSTLAAEVEIAAGPKDEAKVTLEDSHVTSVRWLPPAAGQTAWRLDFGGGASLPDGHLRLLLPEGSRVDVRSASGDVQVAGVKGDVAITSESGEISVKDAQAAKLTSVSGDIELHEVRGAIDAKTTSGALNIQGEIRQALRYTSVSGDLTLSGPCRLATCKITAETVSGNVLLARRGEHALAIRLRSHSGEISGAEGLPVEMKRVPGQATEWTTRLGAGTGTLELSTQSGDIQLDTP